MTRTLLTEGRQVLGILVLNQNGENWLPSVYDSIRAQEYDQVRVYLVDNASTDQSVDLTTNRYPEVTVIRMPTNLGYCMAYNLAMPNAFEDGCDWVIWANNDVRIEPNCLNELARIAQSDSKIGVIGPAFLAWDRDEPNYYMVGNHPSAIAAMGSRSSNPIDVEWVEGSFLMVSRRCYESVGPLDPILFFYWEDADFCRRARFQGWRVVLAPGALARHYAGGWSEADKGNKHTANFLQTRNFYIYNLANPFQGFVRNFAEAVLLFLINMKGAILTNPGRIYFHLRTYGGLLGNLPLLYSKWRRDQAGKKPIPLRAREHLTYLSQRRVRPEKEDSI